MGAMYQGRQMKKNKSQGQGVFSFMENPAVKRRSQRPNRLMEVRGTQGRPGQKPHWLDSMLGSGSRRTVKKTARRVLESNARLTRPVKPRAKAQPIRSNQMGEGRPRRGWIRMGLAAGVLLWVISFVRPVESIQGLLERYQAAREGKVLEKAAVPRPAEGPGEAEAALPPKLELAKLTPVIPGLSSGPVALWKGTSGTWYQVDVDGNLNKSASPQSEENLGLPVLRGVRTRKVADGDRVVLRLDSDAKLLARLFPLDTDLAPEVEMVRLDNPRNPVLVTFDGVRVPLGEGEYQTKQARLALVLNDLTAKKRRAAQVDMRYSNSAVVKLKGK